MLNIQKIRNIRNMHTVGTSEDKHESRNINGKGGF